MKKLKLSLFLSLILFVLAIFSATGCGGNAFTVKFDGNGGELVSGSEVQIVDNVKEISTPVYKREGYNFIGWDIDLSTINSDTVVKAQWRSKEDSVVYNVRFSLETEFEGKSIHVDIDVDTVVEVPANQTLGSKIPTAENVLVESQYRDEYIFYFWYVLDGENNKVPIDSTMTFDMKVFGDESREIMAYLQVGPKWSNRR
ncbi:MAG: InlB B-repeat-containing protein [Clostridia bacterium]|nr:InlB B-repeat-containing protein [Clostridia bacterium]